MNSFSELLPAGFQRDDPAASAAIERIARISWKRDPARLGSQVVLMREYLRRSAVVAAALGGVADWPWDDAAARLTLPGVDPRLLPGYSFLDPETQRRGPEADPLEAKIIALNGHVNAASTFRSAYAWDICLWYIRWEAVKRHPALRPLKLPDLYDPLMTFHERGGWFRPEQGYLDLDGRNVTRRTCAAAAEEEPQVITPAVLDELDSAGLG